MGPPLNSEFIQALAVVFERVFTELLGRTYSPRIKLLDIDDVCRVTTLGASTIDRMVDEGRFPRPQLNQGKKLWRESTLLRWVERNDPNSENE